MCICSYRGVCVCLCESFTSESIEAKVGKCDGSNIHYRMASYTVRVKSCCLNVCTHLAIGHHSTLVGAQEKAYRFVFQFFFAIDFSIKFRKCIPSQSFLCAFALVCALFRPLIFECFSLLSSSSECVQNID